ncbi:MAG: hypothetical protein Q7R31_02935 [Candidatus Levybacteria bacterium]|nr:hypothetical protein [Candidatus Levybacteria bacterium]
MKPQDIVFFIILAVLIWKKDPRRAAFAGIISLIASIPLFSFWVFFTAERLTWYAAAFFLLSIVLIVFNSKSLKNKE